MQNLQDELIKLLSKDERFTKDGKLLKNNIIEAALKLDSSLIKLLLSHKSLKKHFFQDVDGVLVFDKIEFQKFVSNKAFLKDSYTVYSNKIGLTVDDEFITEGKHVVLSWPYKDCMLEGGQTKEDEKRDEIFWNEILAPDEIDRLLSPKVFTNFKKYDSKGEHKISDISLEDNLIIKGNNLLALHSLLPIYAGKVNMIYIDPPYNTDSDSFTYNDSFSHSSWLTFIRTRLNVAKKLLSNQGTIFISCDDNEQPYLKVLCDEIFDRENFISCLPTIMNLKGNNDEFGFAGTHEYTLVYCKSKPNANFYEFDINEEDLESDWEEDTISLFKKGAPLRATGEAESRFDRPKMFYPILLNHSQNIVTTISENEYSQIYNEKKQSFNDSYVKLLQSKYTKKGYAFILPKIDNKNFGRWRWGFNKELFSKLKTEVIVSSTKNGYSIYKKQRPAIGDLPSKKPKTLFYKPEYSSGNGTAQIKQFFGAKVFKNPKPVELIKDFIKIGSGDNDIILDFFAGSGTTAQAVLDLNNNGNSTRKFIICEQLDYIDNITKVRAHKTIKKNANGNFIFCQLNKLNQHFIDKINDSKTTKELKQIWKTIKKDGFISYKINPKDIDDSIKEFEELSLKDQKKFLIAVLDKNHLYVNYSEIEDKDYKISTEDKKLNKKFYSLK